MDFKTLLPDFNAIGKTDWSKPSLKVDTKDVYGLAALAGAALMLVFVFLPWCKVSVSFFGVSENESMLGITTWYGILGLVVALVGVAGVLYKHYSLTFCAAVLGVVVGCIGIASVSSAKEALGLGDLGLGELGGVNVSSIGAVLYLVASVVAGAGAFLKVTKK